MQLARAQLLGKTLDAIAEEGRRNDIYWQPDDQWRSDFREVTATIAQCGAALTKALEANEKALTRATDKQLEAQFKAELLQMARNFTAEEWAIVDNARARQTKYAAQPYERRDKPRPRGRPPKGNFEAEAVSTVPDDVPQGE